MINKHLEKLIKNDTLIKIIFDCKDKKEIFLIQLGLLQSLEIMQRDNCSFFEAVPKASKEIDDVFEHMEKFFNEQN